jgi:hypothetical protein
MRQTANQIIAELANRDVNRCCPNCTSKGPFTVAFGKVKPAGTELELEHYDSFLCQCGQRWSEGFELTYFPRVEYKDEVGDMADIPKDGKLI